MFSLNGASRARCIRLTPARQWGSCDLLRKSDGGNFVTVKCGVAFELVRGQKKSSTLTTRQHTPFTSGRVNKKRLQFLCERGLAVSLCNHARATTVTSNIAAPNCTANRQRGAQHHPLQLILQSIPIPCASIRPLSSHVSDVVKANCCGAAAFQARSDRITDARIGATTLGQLQRA